MAKAKNGLNSKKAKAVTGFLMMLIKKLWKDNGSLNERVYNNIIARAKWQDECKMRFALNRVYENAIRDLFKALQKTDREYYAFLEDIKIEAKRLISSDELSKDLDLLEQALFGDGDEDHVEA